MTVARNTRSAKKRHNQEETPKETLSPTILLQKMEKTTKTPSPKRRSTRSSTSITRSSGSSSSSKKKRTHSKVDEDDDVEMKELKELNTNTNTGSDAASACTSDKDIGKVVNINADADTDANDQDEPSANAVTPPPIATPPSSPPPPVKSPPNASPSKALLVTSPSVSTSTVAVETSTSSKKKKRRRRSKSCTRKNKKQKHNLDASDRPQLAVQVHRFRNANYIPRAILKLCATPLPPNANHNDDNTNTIIAPHLAISREGGSVELVSVDEKWKCVAVVEGMKNRNVDAMAWVCDVDPSPTSASSSNANSNSNSNDDTNKTTSMIIHDEEHTPITTTANPTTTTTNYYIDGHQEQMETTQSQRRLFGASRDGTLFEIDFRSKRHIGVIGSGGGAVFCLTSLYGSGCTQFSGLIAAGCEDGSVRIFKALNTNEGTNTNTNQRMNMKININAPSLELVSTLPSVGNAITSIAWLPPPSFSSRNVSRSSNSDSTPSLEGSVLFAGVADGTIRKFIVSSVLQSNRATGSVPHAMSTGMVLTTSSTDNPTNTATTTALTEDNVMSTSLSSSSSSALTGLQWKSSTRLTVENQGRRTATKIWALKALDDGTLVSGDSMGNIQFWDTMSGTLLQSFEHNRSNADVLDLAVSYDQRKVLASGIDSRVVCIELNTAPSTAMTPNKWILSTQQRHHTHDVHSLTMVYMTNPFTKSSKDSYKGQTLPYRELLCSGGMDTKVSSYFVSKMRKYRPKVVYKYPSNAPVVLSRQPRVMSIMRPDKVDFYQLGEKRPTPDMTGSGVTLDEERAHLGSVCISSNYNLMSFDINDDGKLLAVSHAAGMLLFSVEYLDSYENGDGISRKIVKPSIIDVPSVINAPYSSLKFSRNDPSLLVCAQCNGTINVARIKKDPDDQNYSVSLEHTFDEYAITSTFSANYPITHLDISPDGRWLAAARNTIGKGSINVFALSQSFNHWWTLPCTEAPLSSIRFIGDGDPALATALNNGAFYLFDVEQRCLSEWSQVLGFPATPNLPRELTYCSECPDHIAFNSATPNKFIMGGQTWFCSIDLDIPVPQQSQAYPLDHFKAKNWEKMILRERPRSNSAVSESALTPRKQQKVENTNRNFTICLRYAGMIFLDFLDKNEMVIVEQPWLGIVNALPDALERKRYGS